MKRYFSTYHLTAAAHNARIAGEAEEAKVSEGFDGEFRKESLRRWQPIHDAHVVTTFIESFAGVEASVNELISRPGGSRIERIRQFNENYPGDLIREEPTLVKAQLILRLSGEDEFDKGSKPYQDLELLRKLRNHFIHHKHRKASDSVLERLRSNNIDTNPFDPHSQGHLGGYLSYDCAKWAFFSSIKFLNDLHDRISIRRPYSSYEERLKAEIETDWIEREPGW